MDRPAPRAYLNDHLAGSVTALDLVRRRSNAAEGDVAAFLQVFAAELELEQQALRRAMTAAETPVQSQKRLLALGASWLDALRPRRSPPSGVRDLEALASGVRGKELLWATIGALSEERPPLLDPGEIGLLREMAAAQTLELRRLHDRAVMAELSPVPVTEVLIAAETDALGPPQPLG